MRRAKDNRSNPAPLTPQDAAELVRFRCFLTIASRLKAQGKTREQAQNEAHAAIYPEQAEEN